jgi:uncharacterized membrane protein
VLDFTLEEYQNVWLFMLIGMVIACVCILVAKERPKEAA